MTPELFELEIFLRTLRLSAEKAQAELELLAHLAAQEPDLWPKISKNIIRLTQTLQATNLLVRLLDESFREALKMLEDLEDPEEFEIEMDYEEYELIQEFFEPEENWGS